MQKHHTYLFIHGAWHASWCWQKIAPALTAAGHRVLTPDLPGHGTKQNIAHPVSFHDYLTNMMTLIETQPEPVTLVGHSMAGILISQLAENLPDRIKELIYISAYIPQNQQSLFSIAETGESKNVSPYLIIDHEKQEICLKPSPELANLFFNCCDSLDAQQALSQLQPQPLQPFNQQVSLGKYFNQIPKKSFVTEFDHAILLNDQLKQSQAVTDNIVYLPADHAAYYSAAKALIHHLSQ